MNIHFYDNFQSEKWILTFYNNGFCWVYFLQNIFIMRCKEGRFLAISHLIAIFKFDSFQKLFIL